jgi:hypothetical protein
VWIGEEPCEGDMESRDGANGVTRLEGGNWLKFQLVRITERPEVIFIVNGAYFRSPRTRPNSIYNINSIAFWMIQELRKVDAICRINGEA